ncbi:MAG: CoA transferase [Deltaproteobacteria bacterium]|nr:CoA transferase [Deltaproteobacteria bacterium]
MNYPLHNTLVLDISRVIAGPACSMHLADMGAEVIRIEPPEGDKTRLFLPYSERILDGRLYMPFNRNKKCLGLDIFSGKGKEMFLDLVKKADVLVQNFRPGILEEAGLDYPDLKKINPRLIYCSISGYSPKGDYANRAGFDFAIQAESGLMSINGEPNGDPLKIAIPAIDLQASLYAAMAVSAALFAREQEGHGRLIEVTLFGVAVSLLAERAWGYLLSGEIPLRIGNRGLIKTVVSDYFPTSDGGLVFTMSSQKMWERLCEIKEFSYLKEDPRFADIQKIQENIEDLLKEIKTIFLRKPTREWVRQLALEKGLVCSPVRKIDEVFNDPEIEKLRMVREVVHPLYGPMKILGIPFEFPETPLEVRLPPPAKGGHTDEILRNYFHLTDQEILQLRTQGIIG